MGKETKPDLISRHKGSKVKTDNPVYEKVLIAITRKNNTQFKNILRYRLDYERKRFENDGFIVEEIR